MATLRLGAALAVLVALLSGLAPARADTVLEPLTFETTGGARAFQVEVMRTEAERARGLMFRRYLPPDRGMLFLFDREQIVAMWMKNTFIPLDMVFVGRDGRVVSIAADTEPMSEAVVASAGPANAVVELNAGAAARMGLKAGDRVRHPALGR